jgi:hypothetical protein
MLRNPRAGILNAAEASVSLFQMPMYPFSFFYHDTQWLSLKKH